jgi:hypothetical protein
MSGAPRARCRCAGDIRGHDPNIGIVSRIILPRITLQERVPMPQDLPPPRRRAQGGALALLFLLAATAGAHAGDYAVAWGIEVRGTRDSGTAEECAYNVRCKIRSEKTGLTIDFDYRHDEKRRDDSVYVHVEDEDGRSFILDDAKRLAVIDPSRRRLHQIPIWVGRARRRNEVVENHWIGTLYLGFSHRRPIPKEPVPAFDGDFIPMSGQSMPRQ